MVYYFIDESGSGFSTEGRASLCCVILTDFDEISAKIASLKDDILHDPRLAGILGKFATTGFHFSSDHREIRNAFIGLLRTLAFQAYICFDLNVSSEEDFNSTYDRLFKTLLIDRLRDHKTEDITICFEQHGNQRKRLRKIRDIVDQLTKEIDTSDRRPFRGTCEVISGSKTDLCLSIADYICGIFHAYYMKQCPGEKILEARDFEDLRSKIRCIHDITNKRFYDRRNPFP